MNDRCSHHDIVYTKTLDVSVEMALKKIVWILIDSLPKHINVATLSSTDLNKKTIEKLI